MHTRLPASLIEQPLRWGLSVALALGLIFSVAWGVKYGTFLSFRNDLAASRAPQLSGKTVEATWSFLFQGRRYTVTIPLDVAEISAEDKPDTTLIFSAGGWLRQQYVRDVVSQNADSRVVNRLATAFRQIQDERNLDSDEYLELLVSAVQAIPYGDTTLAPQLPAEMLVRGSGICTDKSMLLGSLLLHEGYDTVLWVFPTQLHVALGVASEHAQFKRSGYAFVETTVPSFIGQAAPEYLASGPVALPPAMIPLGGWREYREGEQVEAILAKLHAFESVAAEPASYESYTRDWNLQWQDYATKSVQTWVADTRARYILGNTFDRPGVYAMLFGAVRPGDARLLR